MLFEIQSILYVAKALTVKVYLTDTIKKRGTNPWVAFLIVLGIWKEIPEYSFVCPMNLKNSQQVKTK